MAYGVATTNLFALLDDENEDPQVLAATKVAKVAPKKEDPKEEAKPAAKPAAPQGGRGEGGRGRGEGRNDSTGEGRGRGRGRGEGRGRGREGRGRGDYYSDRPRYDDRKFQGDGQAVENAEPGFGGGFQSGEGAVGDNAPRGGRGGFRGRGRGRGRRDGEFANREGGEGGERSYGPREDFGERRPPRRQFERHDGTGRGHEGSKRGGAGKGNWGSDADVTVNPEISEPAAEEKQEETVAVEDPGFGGGFASAPAAAAEEGAKPETADAPAAEETPAEEEIQMTLDEYEVILAEKKAKLNKASEANAVDFAQFKGMNAYKRKDEDEDTLGLELKNKREAKQAKEKSRKEIVTLETGFKVQTAEELGGGRGGRGGRGRGGRGRGDRPEGAPFPNNSSGHGFRPPPSVEERGGFAARGRGRGRGTGPAPPIDDESAFPSLG